VQFLKYKYLHTSIYTYTHKHIHRNTPCRTLPFKRLKETLPFKKLPAFYWNRNVRYSVYNNYVWRHDQAKSREPTSSHVVSLRSVPLSFHIRVGFQCNFFRHISRAWLTPHISHACYTLSVPSSVFTEQYKFWRTLWWNYRRFPISSFRDPSVLLITMFSKPLIWIVLLF